MRRLDVGERRLLGVRLRALLAHQASPRRRAAEGRISLACTAFFAPRRGQTPMRFLEIQKTPPKMNLQDMQSRGEVISRGKSGHHRARTVGNADPAKAAGKCHRNDTADGAASREPRTGKGEMVR